MLCREFHRESQYEIFLYLDIGSTNFTTTRDDHTALISGQFSDVNRIKKSDGNHSFTVVRILSGRRNSALGVWNSTRKEEF
jgi:hypothetical protein